jgi:uncharacterized SAM-binding protein YcdF (DUF218 family)
MTMFYLLSKSLLFFLQPSVWIMGLVLWALIERRPHLKHRLLLMALSMFLIFGNEVLYNEVMLSLEPAYIEPHTGQYDILVVLGGYAEYNSRGAEIEFFQSSDRLNKALALYKSGKVKTLLISSGVHPEGAPSLNEAALTSDWLQSCGVPLKDIIKENRSWNTYQNAFYTRQLLDSLGRTEPILVISSASHVNRAEACFKKQGLEVQMLAVDHYSSEKTYGITDYFFPKMRRVLDWEVIIKEKAGMLVYRIQDYI